MTDNVNNAFDMYGAKGYPRISSDSRKEAAFWRQIVLQRCGGSCEICGFWCLPIIHVHHVVHVSRGGNGTPENLIALCPNCHQIIHSLWSKKSANNFDPDFFEKWITSFLTVDQFDLLQTVAHGTAIFKEERWTCLDTFGNAA